MLKYLVFEVNLVVHRDGTTMKNDPHLIIAIKTSTECLIKGLLSPTWPSSYKAKWENLSLDSVSYDKNRTKGHHIWKLTL